MSETSVVRMEFRGLEKVTEVQRALSANLGGQALTIGDLDRVPWPRGGSIVFEIPSLSGVNVAPAIEGIIVHHHRARSYWSRSIEETGGNTPPDCASSDGEHGFGTPGGDCFECPLNQFGTAKGGDRAGKACGEKWILYVLRKEDLLPTLVAVPPTSLKTMRKFLVDLSKNGIAFNHALVRIGLEKGMAGAFAISRAAFKLLEELGPEEAKRSDAYKAQMESLHRATMAARERGAVAHMMGDGE